MLPSPTTPRFTCPAACMYLCHNVPCHAHAMPMPRILRGEADEADSRLSKHSRFSASEFETERELVSNAEDMSHHHLIAETKLAAWERHIKVVQYAQRVTCIINYRLWNHVDATSDWPRAQQNQPDVNYPTRNATISVAI